MKTRVDTGGELPFAASVTMASLEHTPDIPVPTGIAYQAKMKLLTANWTMSPR